MFFFFLHRFYRYRKLINTPPAVFCAPVQTALHVTEYNTSDKSDTFKTKVTLERSVQRPRCCSRRHGTSLERACERRRDTWTERKKRKKKTQHTPLHLNFFNVHRLTPYGTRAVPWCCIKQWKKIKTFLLQDTCRIKSTTRWGNTRVCATCTTSPTGEHTMLTYWEKYGQSQLTHRFIKATETMRTFKSWTEKKKDHRNGKLLIFFFLKTTFFTNNWTNTLLKLGCNRSRTSLIAWDSLKRVKKVLIKRFTPPQNAADDVWRSVIRSALVWSSRTRRVYIKSVAVSITKGVMLLR